MTLINIVEDTVDSTEELRKAFFTMRLDDTHLVDIMIAEESGVIYAMENRDGSTVYDRKGRTYKDFAYDKKKAFSIASAAFEKKYGRKANFVF